MNEKLILVKGEVFLFVIFLMKFEGIRFFLLLRSFSLKKLFYVK